MKIANIRDFTTPEGLVEKVITVEKSKEGVFEAEKVAATENFLSLGKDGSALPVYDIEYKVASSRGNNHYNVRSTVYDKNLYVLTCQCKEDSYDSVKDITAAILNSLEIKQ